MLYHIASAQLAPKKYMVGVNLTHWAFTGLPEIRLNYNIRNDGNLYTGIAVRGGLSNKPSRGGNKVDDGVQLEEMQGGWFMVGLYGRYHWDKKMIPTPWVELLYARSYVHEKGYIDYGIGSQYKTIYAAVNGVLLAFGIDCKIWKGLSGQVGFQLGYYGSREHMGKDFKTFQPGIGAGTFEVITFLPVIGLGYHFGKIK